MPQWLSSQLMRAFQSKNRKQVKLLNDCWFFYRTRQYVAKEQQR
ncbi:cortex morphogenetic protein CmpA [Paenibacillus senegalensis]|nr:cortex morphogenetic protein CmpA [Paenibacillus senegalensis]